MLIARVVPALLTLVVCVGSVAQEQPNLTTKYCSHYRHSRFPWTGKPC